MIKRSFFLLSTAALLFGGAAESIASDSFTTHTQHTPIELKPASFLDLDHSYKTASVCFLGQVGCNSDAGFGIDTNSGQKCIEYGYDRTSCSIPFYLKRACPYNNKYKYCVEDTDRACLDLGYVNTCSEAEVRDPNIVCEYNNNYFGCTCTPCDGFEYTYEQATAQGYEPDGMCQSCDMKRYRRKPKSCTGFLTCECGGEIGASTCYTGSVKKFSKCKSCCENICNETSCPPHMSCIYEPCSQKYCSSGCLPGYYTWCSEPIKNCELLGYTKTISQCPDGYLKCPFGETVFCEN